MARAGTTKKPKPFMSSMFYLPRKLLAPGELSSLRRELTITIDPKAASPAMRIHDEDMPEETEMDIEVFDETIIGYFGVPRHFGLQRYGHLEYLDKTVKGDDISAVYRDLPKITPRDEQQRKFFGELANVCNSRGPTQYVAVAKTGAGKTTSLINAARGSGRPHLVVVHTNRLKEQWLGSTDKKNGLRFFCGEQFVDDYVGIAQRERCDYEGRAIVVAMIQSLSSRRYPPEFYRYFAGVHFDELHKMTAPHFSRAIMLFPQQIRGGMTATMREDALKKISEWHFGPVTITSEQKIQPSKVYEIRFEALLRKSQMNTLSKGTIINSIIKIERRNKLILDIIYKRGWLRGRKMVIMGDRIKHLQEMAKRLIAMGVPKRKVGIYTGEVYTGAYRCSVNYTDPETGKKRRIPILAERGFQYRDRDKARAAAKQFIKANDLPRNVEIKIEEDSYKPTDEWYAFMEKHCDIFFTTYGIFSTGNDISKLNWGLELTPRTDQRQALGRILRPRDDGVISEWYSIADHITIAGTSDFDPDKLMTDLIEDNVSRRKRFKQQEAKIIQIDNVFALLD